MRISKNKDFDRVFFEFEVKEVPEYMIRYTKTPILPDASHIENPAKPTKDEIINIKGKTFVFIIIFALDFEVTKTGAKFPAEQKFTVLQDFQPVDWFENFSRSPLG